MNRIIVHYGEGRGKSSSAIGLTARALAHGRKALAIQFFKPEPDAALSLLAEHGKNLHLINCGNWYFISRPELRYQSEFVDCLSAAKTLIESENIDFILLDEINFAMFFHLLKVEEVIDFIRSFDEKIFILTGRYADEQILQLADTVTEFKNVKHGYDIGIKAQYGVEK